MIPALPLGETVRVVPAPAGEPLSRAFSVMVGGRPCPVLRAKVASRDPALRSREADDPASNGAAFEEAGFANFDMAAPTEVSVASPDPIRSARILPTSAGIVPRVRGGRLTFRVDRPRLLTVEINGDPYASLHVFANPFERGVPKPDDPGAVVFGPGIHELSHLRVGDGGTVYLAPGAVVRCVAKPGEDASAAIELVGRRIRLCGRGILDGSALPRHARNLLFVNGSDVSVEGVTLRDAPTWNLPIRRSDRVTVENVKILGHRANSDGIDVCNSRNVAIRGCFLRTMDDLIVVKTDRGQGPAARISAEGCVLWNPFAHALSIGAELREGVTDVRFVDCDVVHDTGREWTLRVFQSDAARVSGVRFERLRVEESRRLASLWIGRTVWTRDGERGHIADVAFRGVSAPPGAEISLAGYDAAHAVESVRFERVTLGGRPLALAEVARNAFVRDVAVRP